jgi:hypothetical protein
MQDLPLVLKVHIWWLFMPCQLGFNDATNHHIVLIFNAGFSVPQPSNASCAEEYLTDQISTINQLSDLVSLPNAPLSFLEYSTLNIRHYLSPKRR